MKNVLAVVAAVLLTACSEGALPTGTTSQTAADAPAANPVSEVSLRVSGVTVSVPRALQVSEENRYYPSGDIVWRGDPPGDRHAQVKAIFDSAMAQGVKSLKGKTPVRIEIEVLRFHALTEKARYSVGGVHAITFKLTVRNARNGETIGAPRVVEADLKAFGGQDAIDAEARGETQKVRITNHLARVIQEELTKPGGHQNAELGLLQRINKN